MTSNVFVCEHDKSLKKSHTQCKTDIEGKYRIDINRYARIFGDKEPLEHVAHPDNNELLYIATINNMEFMSWI